MTVSNLLNMHMHRGGRTNSTTAVYRELGREKEARCEFIIQTYNFSLTHLQQASHQGKYLDRTIKKTETGNMLNSALERRQLDFAANTIWRSAGL